MLPIEYLEWSLKHGIDTPLIEWMRFYDLTPNQARDVLYQWLRQQGVLN